MKKVEAIETKDRELCNLIKEFYNLDKFEILEAGNDTHGYFRITGTEDFFTKEDLEEILKEKSVEWFSLKAILNDLCRENIIEKGNYIVDFSW